MDLPAALCRIGRNQPALRTLEWPPHYVSVTNSLPPTRRLALAGCSLSVGGPSQTGFCPWRAVRRGAGAGPRIAAGRAVHREGSPEHYQVAHLRRPRLGDGSRLTRPTTSRLQGQEGAVRGPRCQGVLDRGPGPQANRSLELAGGLLSVGWSLLGEAAWRLGPAARFQRSGRSHH